MTDKLPYPELFPYLHPLYKTTITQKLPNDIQCYINNHYDFILPNKYITAEKIQKALNYLNRLYPTDDNITRTRNFIYSCNNNSLYNIQDHDTDGTSYFWVYTVCAFVLLNMYLTHQADNILSDVRHSFSNARSYKSVWNAMYGLRRGGNARANKYLIAKHKAHEKWKTFSNAKKQAKAYNAAFELLNYPDLFEGLPRIPTINTLEKWVRKWKRE